MLEKVNQIRVYSGEKYEVRQRAEAGEICAVTGLAETYPGQGLGEEAETLPPLLEPVLTCQVCLPEGCDPALMLPKLKLLEEEQPELHIVWMSSYRRFRHRSWEKSRQKFYRALLQSALA